MNQRSPFQRRGSLLLILLIAALLSGYLVIERRHMNADSLYYLIPARNFFEGRGLTYAGETHTLFPPGYGIISYPFYLLIGDFEWTGALVSFGAYLVLIGLTYGVSRFLYHDDSALLAAFWVAIAPVILWHSYQALSDLVYAVLYISIYALFWHIVIHQNTFFRSLSLGFLCGMLYLTRPEGLAVGGLVFFGMLFMAWQQKSNFKGVGVFLLLWLMLVGAYILFLHDAEGQWTISGKVRQNIIRDEYVEGTVSDYEDLSVSEFIQQQGWKYVQTTASNFVQGTIQFLGINRHVFFVWGIVWVIYRGVCKRWLPVLQWDSRSRQTALITGLFFIPIFAYPFFYIDYRFFIPHSILMMIPAAFLVTKMLQEIAAVRHLKYFYGLIAVMLLSLPVLLYTIFPFFQDTSLEAIYTEELLLWNSKLAGEWLADHAENPMIASPGKANVIAFYAADGQEQAFYFIKSDMNLPEIVEFMRENRISYLVIERNYQATNPALWELWKNPILASESGLRLKHREARFQIYELTK